MIRKVISLSLILARKERSVSAFVIPCLRRLSVIPFCGHIILCDPKPLGMSLRRSDSLTIRDLFYGISTRRKVIDSPVGILIIGYLVLLSVRSGNDGFLPGRPSVSVKHKGQICYGISNPELHMINDLLINLHLPKVIHNHLVDTKISASSVHIAYGNPGISS